ncbi:Rrf2 family transcriptional regulator [bacterium]|nr:Rrf2 family transcriptional regulator [bacterium]
MKISRRADYAVRVLITLAKNRDKTISARELSEKLNIPYRFLEQVIRTLKQRGYVRSYRGFKGGYQLSCDPETVSLLEIVETIHGPIELVPCMEKPPKCVLMATCTAHPIWKRLDKDIRTSLGEVTLDKLTS